MSHQQISISDPQDHIQGPEVPSSPPPPFTSRPQSPTSSTRLLNRHDPLASEAERTLAETFDSPSDEDDDDVSDTEDGDDESKKRLVKPETNNQSGVAPVETRVTQYPAFVPTTTRVYGTGRGNDGVFANLSAKPSAGEEQDEKPPVCVVITFIFMTGY
jgi:hypothetical protein